jgi:hypothetical protein
MSIPFQIFCNMNTKKFQLWFVSNIHTSESDFMSYRKSIVLNNIATVFPAFLIRLFFETNILTSS